MSGVVFLASKPARKEIEKVKETRKHKKVECGNKPRWGIWAESDSTKPPHCTPYENGNDEKQTNDLNHDVTD